MTRIVDLASVAAAFACAVAAIAGSLTRRQRDGTGLANLADLLFGASLTLVVAVWVGRWSSAGHLPIFGTYESSLSLAATVLLLAFVSHRRIPRVFDPRPLCCAVAALLLAHGLGFDRRMYALTISERSWLVDLHALLAWGAFGALTVNAGVALWIFLSKEAAARSDRWVVRSLSIGFLLHTAMLASGSFYKFQLFGSAWSFDPVETLGLVVWLAYGTLLHMHSLGGWRARRLSISCVLVFLLLVGSYRGIVYYPAWSTYHIFDMDLRLHVPGR